MTDIVDSGPGGSFDPFNVSKLLARIEALEEWQAAHQGLDWGNYGINSPHPNQSIDTAEFGGGADRLDKSGIQVVVGTSATPALYFVSAFASDPANSPPTAYGMLRGLISGGESQVSMQANGTAGANLTLISGSTPEISLAAPLVILYPNTSNPAAAVTGSLFYRSDQPGLWFRDNSAVLRNLLGQDTTMRYVTSSSSVNAEDSVIKCNASGGAITITLPTIFASNAGSGRMVTVFKSDSSGNTVTVSRGGSNTIEGSNTYSLATQYKSVTLIDAGDNGAGVAYWKVLSAT